MIVACLLYTSNLARLGYYIPGYENLAAVHFACVPGQIHLMPRKYQMCIRDRELPLSLVPQTDYLASGEIRLDWQNRSADIGMEHLLCLRCV